MARRRLLTILATTVLTAGISLPAWAGPLDDVTGPIDDAIATVTEPVADATEPVVEAVDDATATEAPADDPSEDDDPSTIDVGTGDGTLDVDLDVDVAPEDADGSPELDIDGGATIADQELEVGSLTDPIEDAVDPDPAPEPAPSGGSTSDEQAASGSTGGTSTWDPTHLGGLVAGGGVVAAGGPAAPFGTTTSGGGTSAWGGGSFGAQRLGGGTMSLDDVREPEVAAPSAESARVAGSTTQSDGVETPAVLATGPGDATDADPIAGLLRVIAAAMVLGTGAAWTRAFRRA